MHFSLTGPSQDKAFSELPGFIELHMSEADKIDLQGFFII